MKDVMERLETLPSNDAVGDWHEVLDRAMQHRRLELRRRALIALTAALLLILPALALAYRFTDVLVVSHERSKPPIPWIAGSRLHDFGRIAERPLASPLAPYNVYPGLFEPSAAIASPDKRQVLYRAVDPSGQPALRIHEVTTRRDRVLEHSVASFAMRFDGAVAYAKAVDRGPTDLGDPTSHVYVRASMSSPAVQWTRALARYTVLAWAGPNLLVTAIAGRNAAPVEGEGLYAFSGPGRTRKLPLGSVLAVDPSGELVIGPATHEPLIEGSLTFRVARVSDGKVLAELDLPRAIDATFPYAAAHSATGGSWAGPYIVVSLASNGLEWSDALVVLRFQGESLTPAHVFRLEPTSALKAGFGEKLRQVFHSPRFVDNDAKEIVAWATLREKQEGLEIISAVVLQCHREEKSCRRTEVLAGTPYAVGRRRATNVFTPRAFVYNPSRPLPSS